MTAEESRAGAVYDLGYAPYEGERTGRRGAIRATARDGMQRVMGIRRRARRKVIPWILVGTVMIPAVVFVGLSFLLEGFAPGSEPGAEGNPFESPAAYLQLTAVIVALFTALAVPELLIPDRREGVLSIYASRPMRADDYVWARSASLATVLFLFMLAPQLLMYFGFAALSTSGFWSGLVDNLDQILRAAAAAGVYILAFGPVALFVAAFATRKAVAAGVFLAAMWLTVPIAEGVSQLTDVPGARFASLVGLYGLPEHVRDWIFGTRPGTTTPAVAGIEPWVSLVVIVAVAAGCLGAVVWRYRRLM